MNRRGRLASAASVLQLSEDWADGGGNSRHRTRKALGMGGCGTSSEEARKRARQELILGGRRGRQATSMQGLGANNK